MNRTLAARIADRIKRLFSPQALIEEIETQVLAEMMIYELEQLQRLEALLVDEVSFRQSRQIGVN